MKEHLWKIISLIPLLLCLSTVDASAPPYSSACLFVGDYNFMGPLSGNNMGTYARERDYLITVEDTLYANKSQYASAAFYGYSDDAFSTQIKYAKQALDEYGFGSEVNGLWPPGSELNYANIASVFDNINKFAWDAPTPEDSCLVFFSGTPYQSKFGQISNSNFTRIFGVSINGATLTGFADNFIQVNVSLNFDSNDVAALVKAILYAPPPTTTTTLPATTVPFNINTCIFIGDYFYLGQPGEGTADTYLAQKQFIIDVDSDVFNSGGYLGNLAIYGYAGTSDFGSLLNMSTVPLSAGSFEDAANQPNMDISMSNNVIGGPKSVIEDINAFSWNVPITAETSCIVFFSGAAFSSAYPKLNNPKFSRIIGVGLSGVDTSEFGNVIPVSISNHFTSTDRKNVVDAILYGISPSTNTPTTPTKAPFDHPACLFIGDFDYLGADTFDVIQEYTREQRFIINVDSDIARSQSYFAGAAVYGYANYHGDDFSAMLQDARNPLDASGFANFVTAIGFDAYEDFDNFADVISDINTFSWNIDIPPEKSCLVYFSGTSYNSSFPQLSNKEFSRTIAVSINGADLSGYGDVIPVSISSDFTDGDRQAVVNAILYGIAPTKAALTTPAPPIDRSCLFIGDYFYLGKVTGNNFGTYSKENDFVVTVDAAVSNNSSYSGSVAFYGYTEMDWQQEMTDARTPLGADDFRYAATQIAASLQADPNIGSADEVISAINKFSWDRTIRVDSCLVIFSGTSNGGSKISNSAFNRIIVVSIDGADLSGFADQITPVSVSSDFNQDDVTAVVNAILSNAPAA